MNLERVLIDDARLILRRAWSVRLSVLSALLGAAASMGDLLPYLSGVLPARSMAALGALAAVAAVVARIVPQPAMRRGGRG